MRKLAISRKTLVNSLGKSSMSFLFSSCLFNFFILIESKPSLCYIIEPLTSSMHLLKL